MRLNLQINPIQFFQPNFLVRSSAIITKLLGKRDNSRLSLSIYAKENLEMNSI